MKVFSIFCAILVINAASSEFEFKFSVLKIKFLILKGLKCDTCTSVEKKECANGNAYEVNNLSLSSTLTWSTQISDMPRSNIRGKG